MASAAVLFATGFEEIEALTVVDVLRRAEVQTTMIGIGAKSITGSHGITVQVDRTIDELGDEGFDVIVLPGGMPGAANLRDDARVQALVQRQHARGAQLAAICAGPIALAKAGVVQGRAVTSYPGFAPQLGAVDYREDDVVQDGTITTSRGPGTALRFALALVARLVGEDEAADLGARMLASP
jgi:4-methyl-5(b-hydroxyethyl)-thiazole monophosphate biosynthesis